MIFYLRGFALDSARPFLAQSAPLELSTKTAFIKYLEDDCGNLNKKGTTGQKLKALGHTGIAAKFLAHFRDLIAVLGLGG